MNKMEKISDGIKKALGESAGAFVIVSDLESDDVLTLAKNIDFNVIVHGIVSLMDEDEEFKQILMYRIMLTFGRPLNMQTENKLPI